MQYIQYSYLYVHKRGQTTKEINFFSGSRYEVEIIQTRMFFIHAFDTKNQMGNMVEDIVNYLRKPPTKFVLNFKVISRRRI